MSSEFDSLFHLFLSHAISVSDHLSLSFDDGKRSISRRWPSIPVKALLPTVIEGELPDVRFELHHLFPIGERSWMHDIHTGVMAPLI
ncbi:hypothetical protein ACFQPE_19720 [Halomarina halobia]|uniref:Uncharacterized protein n=1 Tax=Halomarina halobia TaxID=3033386 RepID=A0ABD6AEL1_9EURY